MASLNEHNLKLFQKIVDINNKWEMRFILISLMDFVLCKEQKIRQKQICNHIRDYQRDNRNMMDQSTTFKVKTSAFKKKNHLHI